ncbi:MAG: hypothetical protein ACQESE_04270 [Nanobdellota archaeon]
MLAFGLLIITTIVLSGCSSSSTGRQATQEEVQLAKCLTEEGFSMYGADWCPHCNEQKERFGTAFKHIDYVDCEVQKSECNVASVQGIPMWTDGEKRVTGAQSHERLAQISGCEYNPQNDNS